MKPPPRPAPNLSTPEAEASEPTFEWARLSRLIHPMQVAVVEALLWIGEPLSAKDFSQIFAEDIGRPNATSYLSYHVRELAKAEVLEARGTESVRGAVRRFYFPIMGPWP